MTIGYLLELRKERELAPKKVKYNEKIFNYIPEQEDYYLGDITLIEYALDNALIHLLSDKAEILS